MKLYESAQSTGYNPMLFLTHEFEGAKTYVLFATSNDTYFRVITSTVASVAGISMIAFSHPFEEARVYGLLAAAILLCISMFVFVSGTLNKRALVSEPPKILGRAPDIYTIEWFFNFLFASLLIITSANYFSALYLKFLLGACAIPPALMAVMPFVGDRLYANRERGIRV
ncbi:MAG: hypothetical protein NXI12_05330 [Alphaproteobacteria bacterium]|nr:hypothetical protein [Alphaproteobacteria bacterium]